MKFKTLLVNRTLSRRIFVGKCKNMCTNACNMKPELSQQDKSSASVQRDLKPFSSIPGPISLPLIGALWKYFPVVGEYEFSNLYESCRKRFEKYGPIVREEMPGANVLYLYKVEDIEEMIRATNDRPERRSHIMLLKYRKSKPDIYNSGGLLPSNGEEWWKIRRIFQKPIGSPKKAAVYIDVTDSIVSELMDKVKREKIWEKNLQGFDFVDHLSRLFLELITLIAFDRRLHSFTEEQMRPNSLTSKMIEATVKCSTNSVKTDNLPEFISKYFPTKAHKDAIEAQEFLEKIALEIINEKMTKMQYSEVKKDYDDTKEKSLLQTYLSDPNYDIKDITGMTIDLMIGGVDTTTHSTSFALYYLAMNKKCQEKLYEESLDLLPNINDKVNEEVLSKAAYLKAVVKETLRLSPVSVGIGRIIQNDIVISGYHIPKGTNAVTMNQLCSRLPQYFENPDDFIPERWMRNSDYPKPSFPFASIPFGHGTRMCIARRLAEQDMYIVLLKLVRMFEIGWNGKKLQVKSESINKPGGPVCLTFKSR